MRDVAQKLHRVTFFLERVGSRIGCSIDVDGLGLKLDRLSRGRRLYEFAAHPQRGPRGDVRELVFRNAPLFDDDLQVLRRGPVLKLYEMYALAISPGFHPAICVDMSAGFLGENVLD